MLARAILVWVWWGWVKLAGGRCVEWATGLLKVEAAASGEHRQDPANRQIVASSQGVDKVGQMPVKGKPFGT